MRIRGSLVMFSGRSCIVHGEQPIFTTNGVLYIIQLYRHACATVFSLMTFGYFDSNQRIILHNE